MNAILIFAAVAFVDTLPLERHEFTQVQMGMPFRVVLYARDEATANEATRLVFSRIKQLNAVFSDYEPDSELNRLCQTAGQGKAVPVSEDLRKVLTRSLELSRVSGGAFDVTVGPVVRLWRKSRRLKRLPTEAEITAARALVGYQHVRLDDKAGTVELLKPGMQLDLGGIAVGYAIDDCLALLKSKGITSALIDGSGDIGVSDAPPGTSGWRIGVAPLEAEAEPSRFLVLKNAAVTTSGDAFQFVEFGGKRYSHIVDPATGLGLQDRASVTVVARDCTTADSYATAVCVMGPAGGLELIEATPNAAALIVRAIDNTVKTVESKRLRDYNP